MKTITNLSLTLQKLCNQSDATTNWRKSKWLVILSALTLLLIFPFANTFADTDFKQGSAVFTLNSNEGYIEAKILGQDYQGTNDELDQIILSYLDPITGTWVQFFDGDMDDDDNWEATTPSPLVSHMTTSATTNYKYGLLQFNYPRALFQNNIVIKAEVDWDIDSNQTNSGIDYTFYYNLSGLDDIPWTNFWSTTYDGSKNTLAFNFENCEIYGKGVSQVTEAYEPRNELDTISVEYQDPRTNQWVKVFTGDCDKNFNDTVFNLTSNTSDGSFTKSTKLAIDRKYLYKTTVLWDKIPSHLWGKTVAFRSKVDWDLQANDIKGGIDQTNIFYITFNSVKKPKTIASGCVYSSENQTVLLKWTDANNVTNPEPVITYHIKRNLKGSTTSNFITPAEGVKIAEFTDKSFENWKDYVYTIYSIPTSWGWTRNELVQEYSTSYSISTNPTIPLFSGFSLKAFPTNVSISPYVKVSWNKEWSNGNVVKLYQRSADLTAYKLLGVMEPGSTSYIDNDVRDNIKYYYKFEVDLFGTKYYKYDSTIVEKSVTFKSIAASKNTIGDRIQLSWEIDALNLCERFEIYRSYTRDSLGMDVKTTPEMVHQLSAQTLYNKWDDMTAVAGVVYEYRVIAYKTVDGKLKSSKSNSDIGFRTPVGTISGRITYGGGTAVDKVSVYVESSSLDENMLYKSLLFKGENSQKSQVNLTNAQHGCIKNGFSFQSWITSSRPSKYTPIVELSNEYSIGVRNDSILAFIGAFNLAKPSIKCKLDSAIQLNNYFHLSVTLSTDDSLKVYINGNPRAKVVLATSGSSHNCTFSEVDKVVGSVVTPRTKCYIGNKTDETLTSVAAYSGNIDDIRLWGKAISAADVLSNYNRYLSGTESGLIGYWPLDEGINSYAFDCSKTNQKFNEHHIKLENSYTSANVPAKEQLAIKGLTDSDGNYIIRGIPFTGEGSTYSIKPALGTHKFEPSQLVRYISPSSLIHNSSDFADKSSFPVKVKVIYNNTSYPVTGVSFSVDENPCSKENKLITTNTVMNGSNLVGECTIDVPIGEHYIKATLAGHEFKYKGRYPNEGKMNFDENTSGITITFEDITLITVAGRVVGGDIEAAHPIGFKQSNANIGKAKIVLKPAIYTDFDLSAGTSDLNKNLSKADSARFQSTAFMDEDSIVVTTDTTTGEYIVKLPPIKWNIESVNIYKDKTYDDKKSINLLKDRIQSFQTSTLENYFDTLRMVPNNKLDTFKYNIKKSFTHKVDPTVEVRTASSAQPMAFGERKWDIDDLGKDTIALYTYSNVAPNQVAYYFQKPIFIQKKVYALKIKAYEKYLHPSGKQSTVPLKGATVTVKNDIGILSKKIIPDPTETTPNHVMKLDNDGEINYIFKAGFPNTTAINEGLEMKISVQNGNDNPVNWTEMGTFKGIVLGCEPMGGTNHVTKGPTVPLVVLRDPPGSNSYSYMEEGSKISYKFSSKTNFNGSFSVKNQMALGVGYKVGAGLGFMVITQIDELNSVTAGLEGQYSSFTGETEEKSITLKERVQTSSSPDFVGSKADVYIGVSTNIYYCLSNLVTIKDKALVKVEAYSGDMTAVTNFKYTQNEILTQQIPIWRKRMQAVLKTVSHDVYISTAYQDSATTKNRNFYITEVAQNSDTLGLNAKYYKVMRPNGTSYDNEVDTIATSILGWQKVISDNEEIKYNVGKNDKYVSENISFDAGVTIDKSYTYTDRAGDTKGNSNNTQGTLATEFGLNINSLGMKINAETKIGGGKESESETATEKTLTYGFVLADPDADNRFSVNVYKNKYLDKSVTDLKKLGDYEKVGDNLGSYIFELKAGQSSCPHEKADSTIYFKGRDKNDSLLTVGPRLPLGNGTFPLDIPYIQIDNSEKADMPNGKEATFVLKLGSNSDMQTTRGYMLSVVDKSNQDGAIISIDGQPLVGGRLFYVTKGQLLEKTLTLKQTKLDVLDYKGIKLRLASPCDTSIYVDKTISVRYVPSCSDLEMTLDRQIINTEKPGALMVTLKNFNQEYRNFLGLQIEYKLEGSTLWNSKVFAKSQGTQKILKNSKNIDVDALLQTDSNKLVHIYEYELPHSDLADGRYIIRAKTLCNNLSEAAGVISNITPEFTVIKDVERPAFMGTPSPSNGILTPETEIAVTFNENIQASRLTPNNFEIKGVLNGATLQHAEGLALDGNAKSEAFTESSISLQNSSFAIEAWVRTTNPTNANLGNVFSIGEGENKVTLKMSGVQIALYVNNVILGTPVTIDGNKNWKYVSLSYNADTRIIQVHLLDGTSSKTVISDSAIVSPSGRLTIGTGFIGNIHQVVIWNESRTIPDLSDMNEAKSGKEPNIIGYWPMNEGYGKLTADKVRSRNMIVNSSWFIDPSGYSVVFDGSKAQSTTINTASIPLTAKDNLSIEFWFNGKDQNNATMFSCGKGTDDPKPENKLSVGFNDKGLLNLNTKGVSYLIPGASVLDTMWHHFTLSVTRGGNSNIFIDGQQKLQIPSNKVGGLATDSISIGARRYADTIIVNTKKVYKINKDQYFTGKMDEVRIWQSALGAENIRLDMRSKLSNTETGLIAYYPFENKEKDSGGVLRTIFSLKDQSPNSKLLANYSNIDKDTIFCVSANTAGIKVPREKENVSFTYTASENKIIFSIDAPLKKIENCVLELAIKKVYDMNGNDLASPIKWTAFVNNNRLNWQTEQIAITKQVLDAVTFKATIINNSGKYENFVIDGLPSWLSVNKSSGRLNPLEKAELTFTVDVATNIGSYESRVTLTGNNGIQEMLPVALKVTGPRPDWTVNAYGYESTMNVMGQIKLDNVYQEDTEDVLAAFNGTRCVGIANPIFNKTLNSYIVFMDVYGNGADNGKNLTYSLWDAGTGRIYPNIGVEADSAKTFIAGSIAGKVLDPIEFVATDKVEQQLSLKQGWTWVSTNVVNTNLLDQFKSGLEASGLQIKNKTGYIDYDNGDWLGYIEDINQRTMYLVNASEAKTIKLEGATAKPADLSSKITINKGWSYIGYVPQFVAPVKEALNGLAPKDGDQIKGQIGFATFDNKEWYGSLQYMTPGLGYMYKSAIETSFNYPAQYISQSRIVKQDETVESTKWAVDVNKYQMSMTITGIVSIDGLEVNNTDQQVAVFIGDECRGTAVLKYIESYNRYVAFLMVWGNTDDLNKKIIFRSFNASTNLEISAINESLSFVPDNITGSVSNPYKISFVSSGNATVNDNDLKIYPNPTSNMLYFSYLPAEVQQVEVIDNVGRRLITFVEMNKNSINVGNLLPGIYTLRVKHNGIVSNHLFVKY